MLNVVCHGKLQEILPDLIRLDVATAGEAIRAIAMQVPAFLKALAEGSYQIIRGNKETGWQLELEDINALQLGGRDLHIIPVIEGASNAKGIAKTIIGVAIIGTAIFMSGGTLATPLAATGLLSGVTFGNVAMIGVALALSGVSQLLSAPASSSNNKKDESFTIDGPGNVYEQGGCVPLVYGGPIIAGGVLISGEIDIEDIGAYRS